MVVLILFILEFMTGVKTLFIELMFLEIKQGVVNLLQNIYFCILTVSK